MRAIEFIPEGIHKNTAMASGDPDEWFMSDHSESSKSVNDTLHKHYRGNSEINPRTLVGIHIKKMDKVLSKFVLDKPAKVYSGIPVSIEDAYKQYKADKYKPIRLHLPAYTSTTTSLVQASNFASYANKNNNFLQVLLIELPIGTPAVSIKNVSNYEYEKEVLLPRGMNIEVQPKPNIIEKNNKKIYIWQAKALGHSPIQIFRQEL